VRGGAAACVDEAGLAVVAASIDLEHGVEGLAGARALAHERQSLGPVARIGERLCRNRTDLALEPRDDRPDGQELRGHGDPELLGVRVAGDDRERHAKARTSSPGRTSCTVALTPMPASSRRSASGVPVSKPNVP
jgi:hypothetical protein